MAVLLSETRVREYLLAGWNVPYSYIIIIQEHHKNASTIDDRGDESEKPLTADPRRLPRNDDLFSYCMVPPPSLPTCSSCKSTPASLCSSCTRATYDSPLPLVPKPLPSRAHPLTFLWVCVASQAQPLQQDPLRPFRLTRQAPTAMCGSASRTN
jgi:hypothetical protein